MKKLPIVIRAKIAETVVNRILTNLSKSDLARQRPGAVHDLEGAREDMEQDVMIVLDQKRWWK